MGSKGLDVSGTEDDLETARAGPTRRVRRPSAEQVGSALDRVGSAQSGPTGSEQAGQVKTIVTSFDSIALVEVNLAVVDRPFRLDGSARPRDLASRRVATGARPPSTPLLTPTRVRIPRPMCPVQNQCDADSPSDDEVHASADLARSTACAGWQHDRRCTDHNGALKRPGFHRGSVVCVFAGSAEMV